MLPRVMRFPWVAGWEAEREMRNRSSMVAAAVTLLLAAGATPDRADARALGAAQQRAADGVIAYSVKTGIYTIRPDGTGMRELIPWRTGRCGRGCTTWWVPRWPRWSPDGRHITYHVDKHRVRSNGRGSRIADASKVYVARADGTRRRLLGRGHNPAWSPDGKEIVYLLNSRDFDTREVRDWGQDYGPMRSVNPLTGERRRWSVIGAAEFSPDGQRIAYLGGDVYDENGSVTQPGGVKIANLDGTNLRIFKVKTYYGMPVRWTADGRVSFNCYGKRLQPDICLLDPQTGKRTRLRSTVRYWDLYAASSPSGRYFAVGGLHGLYITTRAGRMARVLVRNGRGPSYVPSNVPTSPDWRPVPR